MTKTYVNISGTFTALANIYVKDSGSWRTVQNAYVKDGGSWRLVYQRGFTTTVHIASNTQDWVLSTSTVPGWDGSVPLFLTLIVDTGVVVGASSTGGYAMTIGSLPTGSTVTLINKGYIVGHGADGSGSTSSAGDDGGPALSVSYAVTINNGEGVIGGGGGGGGCGGSGGGSGGGGGGAGNGVGSGGVAFSTGDEGSLTGGGRGSEGGSTTDGNGDEHDGGVGGNGGDLGSPGQHGGANSDSNPGSSGGSAGLAINGYSNISWSDSGTIHGGTSG